MAKSKAIAPIEVLRTFHRSKDGFIATARKTEAGLRPLAGLPVDSLYEWFPSMAEELAQDGYFIPNTMSQVGSVSKRTGFAYPIPTNRNVKYLNAQYVDVDNYKLDIPVGIATGVIMDYAENDLIPWPSVFAWSGRGVYSFWILRDEHAPEFAPLANNRNNRETWRAIQTALIQKLLNVGADAQHYHEAGWLRWPGTKHSKSGKVSRYFVNIDGDTGTMPVYTLPQLIETMGLSFAPLPEPPARIPGKRKTTRSAVAGSGGTRARAAHRLRARELEVLNDMRGGFREGCREYALWIYACSLRSMGLSEDEVYEHAFAFADKFKPHLERGRVAHQVRRRANVSRWRNAELARRLNVTDQEAEFLEMIVPRSIRQGREKARAKASKAKTAAQKKKYTAWLEKCWTFTRQKGKRPYPQKKMADEIGVSRMTVHRWEKEMLTKEWFYSIRAEYFLEVLAKHIDAQSAERWRGVINRVRADANNTDTAQLFHRHAAWIKEFTPFAWIPGPFFTYYLNHIDVDGLKAKLRKIALSDS
jgi:DNA-binding XRE family transcriptional regulator